MKSQSCEPKFPTRVEWDSDGSVDVFVDDDEEALLMTAQEGVSNSHTQKSMCPSHFKALSLSTLSITFWRWVRETNQS